MRSAAKRAWGISLATLGLVMASANAAIADFTLSSAGMIDNQSGSVTDPAYNGGANGSPYSSTQYYTQGPSGPSSLSDPQNGNQYSDRYVTLASANSGSATFYPSAASASSLTFSATSQTALTDAAGAGTYVATSNAETYVATFTVNATGMYLVNSSVNSTDSFSAPGLSAGDEQQAQVYLTNQATNTNLFLITSTSSDNTQGGTQSFQQMVQLTAGVTYSVRGFATTSGDINGGTAAGSITGGASLSFSIATVPGPSGLLMAGTSSAMMFGLFGRKARPRVR